MNVAQQVYESMTRFNPNFALIDNSNALTYRQLFSVVRSVQNRLIVGEPVGIYHEPSVLFGVASVACLLKGCPIVPIDTALPDTAIQNIVDELGIKTVFASEADGLIFDESINRIDTGKSMRGCSTPLSLMEIAEPTGSEAIYSVSTSGTTGKPKCIPVTHSAAFESYQWREHYLAYRPNQRVAIHIFAIWELFRPLIRGGCCVFPGHETMGSVDKLWQFLDTYKVDEMLFTPSFLEMLCDLTIQSGASPRSYPRRIVLNGEPVTRELTTKISTVFDTSEIWNLYSIAEAHDISIEKVNAQHVEASDNYVVGVPMPNIKAYVFDEVGMEVPTGQEGELFLEGDKMLGPGYINRPDETAKRFVNTVVDGQFKRLYKTGDRGRFTPCGKLKVSGRSEHMLKRRGFSIQSDDLIESLHALVGFDQGIPWIVTLNKRQWLIFYYTANDLQQQENAEVWQIDKAQWGTGPALKKRLHNELPEYCVPDYFICLESLPIHAVSGKCDFKALPTPVIGFHSEPIQIDGDGLTQFKQLWSQILKAPLDSINLQETFRYNGGDSLAQVQLALRCTEQWGVDLSFDQLSECTGEELYSLLTGSLPPQCFSNPPIARRRGIVLTGATGYVGRHVLLSLLPLLDETLCVYCLIRPKKESAEQRLLSSGMKKSPHVYAIEGDISQDQFGLPTDQYEQLANNTYCVIHCASLVNLVLDDEALQRDVISASTNVISFCQQANSTLHFTSTSAVAPSKDGPYAEALIEKCDPGTGYGRTKQQVEEAIVRSGVRYSIYRLPSLFCAESPNQKDLYTAILENIVRSSSLPRRLCFQLANIRALSEFIARAARSNRQDGILNLMSNRFITANALQTSMLSSGIKLVDGQRWAAQFPMNSVYRSLFLENAELLLDDACFTNNRALQAWSEVMILPFSELTVSFDDWFSSMVDSDSVNDSAKQPRLSALPEMA